VRVKGGGGDKIEREQSRKEVLCSWVGWVYFATGVVWLSGAGSCCTDLDVAQEK